MMHVVIWLPEAMAAYRRLRADDPEGAKRIAAAVAALAFDPRPGESTALGTTSFRRLRLGIFRVLYESLRSLFT